VSPANITALLHQTLLGDAGDHAQVPIIVFDDGRNFVAVNEAYCRFTGYTRDEILTLRGGESLAATSQHGERSTTWSPPVPRAQPAAHDCVERTAKSSTSFG
jgi:PAS domain-containing protein